MQRVTNAASNSLIQTGFLASIPFFLSAVPLCEVPNVHTSLPHLDIKVYSINLYVVIHYIVRYYIVSPLLITQKRYVHEKENHSNNHNALFTDRSL